MLSKKAKYAIHALHCLNRQDDRQPMRIAEIAAEERIPKKFLEAILLELKRNQILDSKKGKGGGYFLLRKPDDISLAEIVRIFDGAIGLIPCVTHRYYKPCEECRDETTCGIRDAFKAIRDITVGALKTHSVADIGRKEAQLRQKRPTK